MAGRNGRRRNLTEPGGRSRGGGDFPHACGPPAGPVDSLLAGWLYGAQLCLAATGSASIYKVLLATTGSAAIYKVLLAATGSAAIYKVLLAAAIHKVLLAATGSNRLFTRLESLGSSQKGF